MTALEKFMSFKSIENLTKDEIENWVEEASQEYYSGEATVPDSIFDEVIEYLRSNYPDSELLGKTGWGYSVPDVSKASHKYAFVGSLNKIHSTRELDIHSSIYVITPKFDGLSVVLYYEDGNLVSAITRGNGSVGIDITAKVIKINSTMQKIKDNFTGSIRGEILMPGYKWEVYKEKYPEAKNARNSASGIINRDEISDDLEYLDIVLYNVTASNILFGSQTDVHNFLNDNTFTNILESVILDVSREDINVGYLEELYSHYKKVFPVDGLVITANELTHKTDETGKIFIYDIEQIAYKFPAEAKDCTVKGISWTESRTGNFVPVVLIDTVELSGTSVSRVSGFNAKFIKDNCIGEGAIINVMKSNEIIPDIQYVVKPADKPGIIDTCPECGKPLIWDGVNLKCGNDNCPTKSYMDLKTFVTVIGKQDNIGWAIEDKIFSELNISSISDLFEYANNLRVNNLPIEIDDKGQTQRKLFNKVLSKLFNEPIDAVDALCALNIPRLGKVSASKIAPDKELFEALSAKIPTDKITEVVDKLIATVGSATTDSIVKNYEKLNILNAIADRVTFSNISTEDAIPVAITGKLSMKRADFEKILIEHGFKLGAVNKNCKFLITDNPNSSSSKNKLADELGIEKITEDEFTHKYLK